MQENIRVLYWAVKPRLLRTPRYFEPPAISNQFFFPWPKSTPLILNSNYKVDGQTLDGVRK